MDASDAFTSSASTTAATTTTTAAAATTPVAAGAAEPAAPLASEAATEADKGDPGLVGGFSSGTTTTTTTTATTTNPLAPRPITPAADPLPNPPAPPTSDSGTAKAAATDNANEGDPVTKLADGTANDNADDVDSVTPPASSAATDNADKVDPVTPPAGSTATNNADLDDVGTYTPEQCSVCGGEQAVCKTCFTYFCKACVTIACKTCDGRCEACMVLNLVPDDDNDDFDSTTAALMDTPQYQRLLEKRAGKSEKGVKSGVRKQLQLGNCKVSEFSASPTMTELILSIKDTKVGALLSEAGGWSKHNKDDVGGERIFPDGHRWSLADILGADSTARLVNQVCEDVSSLMDEEYVMLPNATEGSPNYGSIKNPQLVAWGKRMPRCHTDNGQDNCFSVLVNVCDQKPVLVFPDLVFPAVSDVTSKEDARNVEATFNGTLSEAEVEARVLRPGVKNKDMGSYVMFPSNVVHVGHPTEAGFCCQKTGFRRRTILFLPLVRKKEADASVNNPEFNTDEPCGSRGKFAFLHHEVLFPAIRGLLRADQSRPRRATTVKQEPKPKTAATNLRRSGRAKSTSVVDLSGDDGVQVLEGKMKDTTHRVLYELGDEVATIANFNAHAFLVQKRSKSKLQPGVMVTLKDAAVNTLFQVAAIGTVSLGSKPKGGENLKAVAVIELNKQYAVVSALSLVRSTTKARWSKAKDNAAHQWIATKGKMSKPRCVNEIVQQFGLGKPSDGESDSSEEENSGNSDDTGRPTKKRKREIKKKEKEKKKAEVGSEEKENKEPPATNVNKAPVYVQPPNTQPEATLSGPDTALELAVLREQQIADRHELGLLRQQLAQSGSAQTPNTEATTISAMSDELSALRQRLTDQKELADLRQQLSDKERVVSDRLWTCVGATMAAATRGVNQVPPLYAPQPQLQYAQLQPQVALQPPLPHPQQYVLQQPQQYTSQQQLQPQQYISQQPPPQQYMPQQLQPQQYASHMLAQPQQYVPVQQFQPQFQQQQLQPQFQLQLQPQLQLQQQQQPQPQLQLQLQPQSQLQPMQSAGTATFNLFH